MASVSVGDIADQMLSLDKEGIEKAIEAMEGIIKLLNKIDIVSRINSVMKSTFKEFQKFILLCG